MMCAWKELLALLPPRLRREVDELGKEAMQELRLRCGAPPALLANGKYHWLSGTVTREDLNYVVNAASRYSPWAAESVGRGYITATGGHRIGICGEAVCRRGQMETVRTVESLCIRVARDFPGIAAGVGGIKGSVLIIGAPGWGKTTLLRDLIRQIARTEPVCVVDERGELFPQKTDRGIHTDVLTGCPKTVGLEMVLRTMSPAAIAVDEITEPEDCRALINAANCGIRLLATAHASSLSEFKTRGVYRPLWETRVFDSVLILRRDKSYTVERMGM